MKITQCFWYPNGETMIDYLHARVDLENKNKNELNLLFHRDLVLDEFGKIYSDNFSKEDAEKEFREKFIEPLLPELIEMAMSNEKVKEQIAKKEVGQFIVPSLVGVVCETLTSTFTAKLK